MRLDCFNSWSTLRACNVWCCPVCVMFPCAVLCLHHSLISIKNAHNLSDVRPEGVVTSVFSWCMTSLCCMETCRPGHRCGSASVERLVHTCVCSGLLIPWRKELLHWQPVTHLALCHICWQLYAHTPVPSCASIHTHCWIITGVWTLSVQGLNYDITSSC